MMKSVALMSASSPEPLAGIRVVSLASNLPGPIAAAQLASMGAQVTKIEPPAGDPLAAVARAWYNELVADQEIVVLDLKQSEQRGRLDDYLAEADALITAMRPSALSRLDLHRLSETHPALVHVEIVGHDGDAAEVPGHDLTYQAAHGTLCPPTMPLVPVADLLGAERAVSAAVAGLLSRTRVGRGGHYKIVLDHAAQMAGAAVRHGLMGPATPLGGALPTYRIYPTLDGYVALGALEPHFAARVTEHIGRTIEELESTFKTRTTSDWEAIGRELDIPLAEVKAPTSGVTND
ncbi:CoA transferase [Alloalcanivorax xenomutans]|jgi:alpha-methylacyl-CoA racemase|uniref:CoA transferase n=1 Tax=Alloalcanivorax xenomutans TaxID=1094342 RepID=A0A9Q3W8W9_9GAMM|nr:CoA transferase [Alloalcanivorax xenomutans]MCE7511225.1 CoA transferase [Alloalcanivorax xenomutans]WOD27602.1 CoA transferase [Alloalcanivorax xenomutans]|tara:strand:- start:53062 stop:53937 length:876 start_codon:yes stop_codon:yes gene_type:complete